MGVPIVVYANKLQSVRGSETILSIKKRTSFQLPKLSFNAFVNTYSSLHSHFFIWLSLYYAEQLLSTVFDVFIPRIRKRPYI